MRQISWGSCVDRHMRSLSIPRSMAALVLAGASLVVVAHPGAAQAGTSTPCGTAPPGMNVIVSNAATITGTGGDDWICAGAGANTIVAGAGDDIVFGRGGADVIRGGPGEDTLWGGAKADRLIGGPGTDTIRGNGGADLLLGGGGDDELLGGGGADALDGGTGPDDAHGGPLNDACTRASTKTSCEVACPGPALPAGATVIDSVKADFDGNGMRETARAYVDTTGDLRGHLTWDDGGRTDTLWEDPTLVGIGWPEDAPVFEKRIRPAGVTGDLVVTAEYDDGVGLIGKGWLLRGSKDAGCVVGFVAEFPSDGLLRWDITRGEVLSGGELACEATPAGPQLWSSSWTVDGGTGDVTELLTSVDFVDSTAWAATVLFGSTQVVGNVNDPGFEPQSTFTHPAC